MERAAYLLLLEAEAPEWQAWVTAVRDAREIIWEKTTKSGKKQQVNLRDRLDLLEVVSPETRELPFSIARPATQAILRYVGSCRNDGTALRPENVAYAIERVCGTDVRLLKIHREQLLLRVAA